jgi:hypothetical protein
MQPNSLGLDRSFRFSVGGGAAGCRTSCAQPPWPSAVSSVSGRTGECVPSIGASTFTLAAPGGADDFSCKAARPSLRTLRARAPRGQAARQVGPDRRTRRRTRRLAGAAAQSPRPDEQPFRDLKLLVDHRDDLVDERRRAQQRLRWHLHQLDPSFAVPAKVLDRPVHLDRVGRWLARRQPEVQVRGRILESCATDRGSYTSAPIASGPKYSILGRD